MTLDEFSHEFDILLNSYSRVGSFAPPTPLELDEYEKSVLLTTAQEDLIKNFYSGNQGGGFEYTEEMRRALSTLVTDYICEPKITKDITYSIYGNPSNSNFFKIPDEAWVIIYRTGILNIEDKCGNSNVEIVPIRHDEWDKIKKNPFRKPSENKAVCFDRENNLVEVIYKDKLKNLYIRYIRKPKPIVLVDFDDVSVNGIKEHTNCELDPILHRAILANAVQLAFTRFSMKEAEKE